MMSRIKSKLVSDRESARNVSAISAEPSKRASASTNTLL